MRARREHGNGDSACGDDQERDPFGNRQSNGRQEGSINAVPHPGEDQQNDRRRRRPGNAATKRELHRLYLELTRDVAVLSAHLMQ